MKKIVFLVSGNGGTFKFLLHAIDLLELSFQIVGVVADRDCGALEFASQNNIYAKKINYTRSKSEELKTELEQLNPDLIVTNIHKIIDEETLNLWNGKFLNIHYSLLPGFGGLIGMQTLKNAKEQNVKFIGGTCHKVTKEVDAGMILQQGCYSVDWQNAENAQDTIFKISCFCLLACIYENERTSNETILLNNHHVHFAPKLPFIIDKFDSNFWTLINNK